MYINIDSDTKTGAPVPDGGWYHKDFTNVDIFLTAVFEAKEDGKITIAESALLGELARHLKIYQSTKDMAMGDPSKHIFLPVGEYLDLDDEAKKTIIYDLYVKAFEDGIIIDDEERIINSVGLMLGLEQKVIDEQEIGAGITAL